MKKTVLIFFLVLIFGCAQDRIQKPKPLLSLEEMTAFHVDLALLNAASSYVKDSFVPIDSLYKFHGIDSLTFVKNNLYYASKPKVYTKIFDQVKTELEKMNEIDTLLKPIKMLPKE